MMQILRGRKLVRSYVLMHIAIGDVLNVYKREPEVAFVTSAGKYARMQTSPWAGTKY